MTKSRHRSIFDLAAGLALAGPHAAVTLAYRMPLFAATSAPSAASRKEMARMVHEKVGAAVLGAIDGQKVVLRLAAAALTGRLQPSDIMGAPAAIAAASLEPAFRRVRSNSKRLQRRRSAG